MAVFRDPEHSVLDARRRRVRETSPFAGRDRLNRDRLQTRILI